MYLFNFYLTYVFHFIYFILIYFYFLPDFIWSIFYYLFSLLIILFQFYFIFNFILFFYSYLFYFLWNWDCLHVVSTLKIQSAVCHQVPPCLGCFRKDWRTTSTSWPSWPPPWPQFLAFPTAGSLAVDTPERTAWRLERQFLKLNRNIMSLLKTLLLLHKLSLFVSQTDSSISPQQGPQICRDMSRSAKAFILDKYVGFN